MMTGERLKWEDSRSEESGESMSVVPEEVRLFVCDRVTSRILRVTADGTVTGYAYNTDEWTPVSASWTAGSLYVLEVHDATTRTVRYDSAGQRHELVAANASARPVGDSRPIWLG